jgi:hypothetical protein
MLIAIWRGHVGTIVRLGLMALRHTPVHLHCIATQVECDDTGIAFETATYKVENENA